MRSGGISMLKEVELFNKIKSNIENSFGGDIVKINKLANEIIIKFSFANKELTLLKILKNTSKEIDQNSEFANFDTKQRLKIETYVDVLLCLKVYEIKKFTAKDIEECKLAIQKNEYLLPFFKDLAYFCTALENIMHNFSLADYRQYKKAVYQRIGE